MNFEDKIREAVKYVKNNKQDCNEDTCRHQAFCAETEDYTGMTFCNNTATQIIDKLNED